MTKTSVFAAAAGLLALAGVCSAQPPGITPEMINRALPLEGAPLAVPGPYAVTSEKAFGSPGLLVFHPTNLDAFPKTDTLPLMVWGNGGCAIETARYSGFLTTIASHGFLVMGTTAQEGAARRQATADDMRAAVDWAEKENTRDGSPLKGKIAMDKVAVMGQSCGGFLSISLGADPRVETIGVFNSGVLPPNPNAPPSPFPTADGLKKPARSRAARERSRARLHDGEFEGDVRGDQQLAGLLRRAAQRRPHGDGFSPGRRRVRQRRVELDEVEAQRGQESRGDVRRQEL